MPAIGVSEIAIVVLWIAILVVVLFVPFWVVRQIGRNRREIDRLERRLDDLERQPGRDRR